MSKKLNKVSVNRKIMKVLIEHLKIVSDRKKRKLSPSNINSVNKKCSEKGNFVKLLTKDVSDFLKIIST